MACLDLEAGTYIIPLSYMIIYYVAPVPDPTTPIPEHYVFMEPHHGQGYQEDNTKVLNIAISLIKYIQVSNTHVQIFLAESDRLGLVMLIFTHCRGQGILNHDLVEAGAIIDKSLYLV